MSYILDALKKAEAERNAGAAPAATPPFHADQPAIVPSMDDESSERRKAWIRFALSAVAAVLLAFAWFKPWRAAPPTVAPPPMAAASAPEPQVPPVAQAEPPAPAHPASTPPSVDDAAAPVEAAPKPVKPKPRPAAKKPAKAAAPAESKPAEAGTAASEERVMALRELPPHIQSEIPALTISGYIYSENKSDRTVLINKRLLREGDQVAPDLILEKLMPTGMVLNYKGYRYRSSYENP